MRTDKPTTQNVKPSKGRYWPWILVAGLATVVLANAIMISFALRANEHDPLTRTPSGPPGETQQLSK